MPLPIPDYATVIEPQALAFARNRFPGRDTHSESYIGKKVRSVARMISYLFVSLQSVDNDAVPTQATSLGQLQNMASNYGLPSNTGGFGANGATIATGGVANITGTNGTTYTNGTQLLAPDGVTVLQLSGTVTIPGMPPGSGSVSGNIVAVTAGTVGNLPTSTVLNWNPAPSGSDASCTLTSPLTGAIDSEAKAPLLARIQSRFQTPPKGGASPDYRTWAETAFVNGTSVGIYRAYVYPKRHGTGTVDIVITVAGSGSGRKPTSTQQTNVSNYINGNSSTNPPIAGQRPVTSSGVNVLLPTMTGGALTIRVRIVPSQNKYAFDWALGTSTFTVSSYAAGPPGVITMNQSLPASLTAAVDAGSLPRLQVMSAGLVSPGIPVPVQVTAYNAGAKTLTLQNPLPTGWVAPSASDAVYPYSAAVPIVAQGAFASATPAVIGGVQAYIDSLGPSRASGYANSLDVWSDIASVFTVGEVALDSTDTDGVTKVVGRVLAATINGGTTDIEATDGMTNSTVQLLSCATIAVTD